MLLSFGVVSKDALKTGRLATASKHELVRTLHDFLLSLVPLHGSAVLIIDEAQHLSTDVLEEIRILSNLETNDQKLLQIVIVGQLNLLDVLAQAGAAAARSAHFDPLFAEGADARRGRGVRHAPPVGRARIDVGDVHAEGVRPGALGLGRRAAHDQPAVRSRADGRVRERRPAGSPKSTSCTAAGQLGHEIPKGKIKGERATHDGVAVAAAPSR